MIEAPKALERLREGNLRFAADKRRSNDLLDRNSRRKLVEGQTPFAAILGCSDSRVPVESVFDQDVGDLFVIRVAGNVVTPPQIGSIEFATESFGVRLVVVLGHTRCGAVQATLDALRRPDKTISPNLQAIVDRIEPSVTGLLKRKPPLTPEDLLQQTVRANVRATADHLRHGSEILERRIQSDGLVVVGAEYSLETGLVDVFYES